MKELHIYAEDENHFQGTLRPTDVCLPGSGKVELNRSCVLEGHFVRLARD